LTHLRFSTHFFEAEIAMHPHVPRFLCIRMYPDFYDPGAPYAPRVDSTAPRRLQQQAICQMMIVAVWHRSGTDKTGLSTCGEGRNRSGTDKICLSRSSVDPHRMWHQAGQTKFCLSRSTEHTGASGAKARFFSVLAWSVLLLRVKFRKCVDFLAVKKTRMGQIKNHDFSLDNRCQNFCVPKLRTVLARSKPNRQKKRVERPKLHRQSSPLTWVF